LLGLKDINLKPNLLNKKNIPKIKIIKLKIGVVITIHLKIKESGKALVKRYLPSNNI
jgi:hypothetical protein